MFRLPTPFSFSDNIILSYDPINITNDCQTILDISDNPVIPAEFNLAQNYPNPFNPTTTIQFAISSMQFVELKVYDLLGREVAILVNEEKPAGIYKIEFDAASLPSGIYFYNLKAGRFVDTKKMVLMR